MDDSTRQELKNGITLSLDDLFFKYGKYQIENSDNSQFNPLKKDDLKEFGKKAFFNNAVKLKHMLCDSEKIKSLMHNETLDEMHIVNALYLELFHIDWLHESHRILLTLLLAKFGLKYLCQLLNAS